jgi:hypothetical protein
LSLKRPVSSSWTRQRLDSFTVAEAVDQIWLSDLAAAAGVLRTAAMVSQDDRKTVLRFMFPPRA